MIRRVIALAMLLGCTGCNKPGIRVETVPVPVAARCVDPANIPAEPPHVNDQLTGDADRDVNIIGSSALLLRAWGKQLQAIVAECAK